MIRVPALLRLVASVLVLGTVTEAAAQQIPDSAFAPNTGEPAYAVGAGPVVLLDGAHNNFHTVGGRYFTFARVLRADGFVVRGGTGLFTPQSLEGVDVLVIANALHDSDVEEWRLPNPSAFTPAEIGVVSDFVRAGGSLLLIADHMPFPGAAEDLAAEFGFELMNGFVVVPGDDMTAPLVLRVSDGTLARHVAVQGTDASTTVDSVATFTGEAFQAPPGAVSLLTLPEGAVSFNPEVAWEFDETTEQVDVGGWSQGAVLGVGAGRVAMFGEAAMFSAQLAGPAELPMGMNAPVASGNPRLLVNLLRWLAGAEPLQGDPQ